MSMSRANALEKWWQPAVALAYFIFFAYEVGIGCNWFLSSAPLCPFTMASHGASFASLGGFVIVDGFVLYKLGTISSASSRSRRTPYWVALHTSVMGTISTALATIWNYGGTCSDAFGFALPASVWGEWIATAPLCIFVVVVVADREDLSLAEIFPLVSFFLCIVFAWVCNFPQPKESAIFFITLSFVSYVPVFWLPLLHRFHHPGDDDAMHDAMELQFSRIRLSHQYNLAVLLAWVLFPIFPLCYILSVSGAISPSTNVAVLHVFSMLTKGLFAAIVMDIHERVDQDFERELIDERGKNEARRSFMKYIFHEVRTPLSSLTMGIDLLSLSTSLDEQDKESLEIMRAASSFMSKTLNGVLSMQKIEEGKFELEYSTCSLQTIVRTMLATLTGSAAKKNLSMTTNFDAVVPALVRADGARLEHIVSNLVSNAIKFSPENSEISVSLQCDSVKTLTENDAKLLDLSSHSGKKHIPRRVANVTCRVKDQGVGLSPENQAKLFQSFVQIRPGALQSGQGSGLGLAFCKHLVEMHGGVIGVESKVGEGSTFFFTCPYLIVDNVKSSSDRLNELQMATATTIIAPPNATASSADVVSDGQFPLLVSSESPRAPAALTPQPTPTTTDASNSGAGADVIAGKDDGDDDDDEFTVLVVDDSPANRKMLQMLLKRKGVKSESCNDGLECVEKTRQHPRRFKLVMIDNLMPTMNGLDATRTMREDKFPFIICGVTGNVLQDDLDEYLDSGADLILRKPCSLDMIDMILRLVAREGYASRPGMKLVQGESGQELEWHAR